MFLGNASTVFNDLSMFLKLSVRFLHRCVGGGGGTGGGVDWVSSHPPRGMNCRQKGTKICHQGEFFLTARQCTKILLDLHTTHRRGYVHPLPRNLPHHALMHVVPHSTQSPPH